MEASQVVLYFDRPEDALRFTMAASSLMSDDDSVSAQEAVATGIVKATRITTQCTLGAQPADAPHTREKDAAVA